MKRQFNYTGRKTIEQSRACVSLRFTPGALPSFDASVDLSGLGLPDDALVYVEAHHKGSYMRFQWGRVGRLAAPAARTLDQIDRAEGVQFRVKVVEEAASTPGRLLALCEHAQVNVSSTDDEASRKSLLPVRLADIGDLVWDVDFESERPALVISERVPDLKGRLRSDVGMQAIMYPEALRRVLCWYFLGPESALDDTDDPWATKWRIFAAGFVQVPVGGASSEVVEEWISDVVREFASRHRLGVRFAELLTAEGGG